MSECFFIGKVIGDVEFSFTLKKFPISISKFKMRLSNKSNLTVYGYDGLADFCYSRFKENDLIFVYGRLELDKDDNIACIAKELRLL